jgi:hypothetical protein
MEGIAICDGCSHGDAEPRLAQGIAGKPNLFPNRMLGTATIGILPASRLLIVETCASPWREIGCSPNYVPPIQRVRTIQTTNR